ncbi:MAG: alpha/beta hydrolase [Flavobacteriaceae bacterium]|jgi:pimeloyl-ACP methyl ester carboxylesterase|nr:alpha/beta hydrolase [Flavobacteriaceae bacterium]
MRFFQIFAIFLFIVSCTQFLTSYEKIEKNEIFFENIADKLPGNFVLLSEGMTYYEEINSASDVGTLIFVHGFSVPSYIWSPTYESAAQKGYRVIRMDLYGRGYSANPNVPYTDTLFAKQVLELLDFLNVEQANFLGLSNGGRVISKIAFLNKDVVERLIYVASSGFQKKNSPRNKEVSQQEIDDYIETYPLLAESQRKDFKNPEQFPDWGDKYEKLLQYKGFANALLSTRKNHVLLDFEHEMINETGIPVYTIFGDSDPVVVYDTFRDRLSELLPNRNEIFISKSGHLPHMENQNEFEAYLFENIIKK